MGLSSQVSFLNFDQTIILLEINFLLRPKRLYDIEANKIKHSYKHKMAVLDCCFSDTYHAYSGGLDKKLLSYDFIAQRESVIGEHDQAIRCVLYSPSYGLIITGSWDRFIRLWDVRMPKCVSSYEQPDSVSLPQKKSNLEFNKYNVNNWKNLLRYLRFTQWTRAMRS